MVPMQDGYCLAESTTSFACPMKYEEQIEKIKAFIIMIWLNVYNWNRNLCLQLDNSFRDITS